MRIVGKHVSTPCGQNVETVNLKAGGTYSYHYSIKKAGSWNVFFLSLTRNMSSIVLLCDVLICVGSDR